MIRNRKNPNNGLVVGIGGLLLAGFLIIKLNPDMWWKEFLVVDVSGVSVFFIFTRILKNIKGGVLGTVTLFSFLILNRFGVLDLLTVALLVIIMGLISLIY